MPQSLAGEPALMRQRPPELQVIDLAALIHARKHVTSGRLHRGAAIRTRIAAVAGIITMADADRPGHNPAQRYASDSDG